MGQTEIPPEWRGRSESVTPTGMGSRASDSQPSARIDLHRMLVDYGNDEAAGWVIQRLADEITDLRAQVADWRSVMEKAHHDECGCLSGSISEALARYPEVPSDG